MKKIELIKATKKIKTNYKIDKINQKRSNPNIISNNNNNITNISRSNFKFNIRR